MCALHLFSNIICMHLLQVGNFIGHGALLTQRNQGIRRKLVQFLLDDHDVDKDLWPWGGEAIYR